MTLSTVTLKWDLTDLIQAGLAATLSITPTAQMSDTADHVLIPPVARTYTFTGGTGQLAGIVANDNAAILPAGAGYLISVTAANGQVIVPQFQAQLLTANAVAGVLWLDQLAIVPVVATSYQYLPLTTGTPAAGQVPAFTGSGYATAPATVGGTGTVTSASVVSANGLAGTVANPSTVPAITLETTVTAGMVKSTGTALAAATAGTDYLAPNGSGAALTGITAAQAGADASGAAAAVLASSLQKSGGTMGGELSPAVAALTFGATVAVNAAAGNAFNLTLTASTGTIANPTSPADGQVIRFRITQDGTGSRTVAWGTAYDFGAAGAPVLSTTAAKTDIIAFEYVASISKWAFLGSGLGF